MEKIFNLKNETSSELTIDIDGVIGDDWYSGSEDSKIISLTF